MYKSDSRINLYKPFLKMNTVIIINALQSLSFLTEMPSNIMHMYASMHL
jgi:hypothetical protein